MQNTSETFKQELTESGKIPCFEIEVLNLREDGKDYIIFDIEISELTIKATHDSLSTKQIKSNKTAFVSIDTDYDFSLSENLESLYDSCINAIIGGNLYDLV